MPLPTPPVLPQPFANNAGGSFVTDPIPNTTVTPGAASYDQGFPPETMQPEVSGGVPPFGQDVNGILKALSEHTFKQQAGQLYFYSATVAAAIGGYPLGVVLGMTDASAFQSGAWINVQDNNMSDPDAGGAGWVAAYAYGIGPFTVTGGAVTLPRSVIRFPIIYIGGVLGSNSIISIPDGIVQRWLVANNTTGAHTLTVKTVSGTGVVIPQGGTSSPTDIYSNGTNIHLADAPATLPLDVNPSPNSIVQRDNTGNVLAHYLHSDTALETPAVGAVIVENAAADGFLRKISLADFEAQLFNGNLATNGHIVLPGGLILQWGSVHGGDIPASPTPLIISTAYDVAFPNAIFGAPRVSMSDPFGGVGGVFTPIVQAFNQSGVTFYINELNAGVQDVTFHWFAIGF